MPSHVDPSFSSTALLTIDVDAEVRKLCSRQFASKAEQLAELVRTVIFHGAAEVRVRIARRRVTLVASGAELPLSLMDTLGFIRDPAVSQQDRHLALVAGEQRHGLGFLALLSEPRLLLHCGTDELRLGPDGSARRRDCRSRPLVIELRRGAAPLDGTLLARACLYSDVPIFVDGRRVSHGLRLPDALLTTTFDIGDGDGIVGLPRRDELCRTAYIRREVIQYETVGVSSIGAAHIAVVRDRTARGSEDLRRDRLGAAVRTARARLYRELRARFFELPPRDRVIARNLLFRRSTACQGENNTEADLLSGLAIFRRLAGGPVAVAAVVQTARDGVVWAVDAATSAKPEARSYLVERSRVFLLDERERAFLSDLHGIVFTEPPVRAPEALLSRLWARTKNGGKGVARVVSARLARLYGSRWLDPLELTEAERRLVCGIEAELESGRFLLPGVPVELSRRTEVVVVQRGALPPRLIRRAGQCILCLPRPEMQSMAAAFVATPGLIYPILAAVFCGSDGYGARKTAVQAGLLAGLMTTTGS